MVLFHDKHTHNYIYTLQELRHPREGLQSLHICISHNILIIIEVFIFCFYFSEVRLIILSQITWMGSSI